MPGKKIAKSPKPKISKKIKHIAGEGLARPSALKANEVRELAAEVLRQIEPRNGKIK